MIQGVTVLSQGNPPGPPDDPLLSPLEAAQLEYEGPAAVSEGGDQGQSDRPEGSRDISV